MPISLKELARAAALTSVVAAAPLAIASLAIAQEYNPQINPADFSTTITNPLFNLPIGKRMEYLSKTEDGTKRIVITITGATRAHPV